MSSMEIWQILPEAIFQKSGKARSRASKAELVQIPHWTDSLYIRRYLHRKDVRQEYKGLEMWNGEI